MIQQAYPFPRVTEGQIIPTARERMGFWGYPKDQPATVSLDLLTSVQAPVEVGGRRLKVVPIEVHRHADGRMEVIR